MVGKISFQVLVHGCNVGGVRVSLVVEPDTSDSAGSLEHCDVEMR